MIEHERRRLPVIAADGVAERRCSLGVTYRHDGIGSQQQRHDVQVATESCMPERRSIVPVSLRVIAMLQQHRDQLEIAIARRLTQSRQLALDGSDIGHRGVGVD